MSPMEAGVPTETSGDKNDFRVVSLIKGILIYFMIYLLQNRCLCFAVVVFLMYQLCETQNVSYFF